MSDAGTRMGTGNSRLSAVEAVARIGFLGLLPVIVYLTTKPGPAIVEEHWIPRTAARWFDMHDGWKNLSGFAALGWLAFVGWPRGIRRILGTETRHGIALQVSLLSLLVAGLELLQLAIPTRVFDLADILNGIAGILLSLCLAAITRRLPGVRAKV